MLTKEKIASLLSEGALEECLLVAKAYKTKEKHPEAGLAGNIHHVCATCGRGFDQYIKLKEGTAVCSHCEGHHQANQLLMILGDEMEEIFDEMGGQQIANDLLKATMQKAISKMLDKIQNI